MTEVEVNGTGAVDLDFTATKIALSSSSTSQRIDSLQIVQERLSKKGNRPCYQIRDDLSFANIRWNRNKPEAISYSTPASISNISILSRSTLPPGCRAMSKGCLSFRLCSSSIRRLHQNTTGGNSEARNRTQQCFRSGRMV
jgi:hypothetical protein